jgi:hypothetical protein
MDNTYGMEQVSLLPTHGAVHVTVHDLDHDGRPEIIFCNTMRGFTQFNPRFPCFLYYGDKDRSYSDKRRDTYPVPMGAYSYSAADIDNDGVVELVFGINSFTTGLRCFKGRPKGPDPGNYFDIEQPQAGVVILGDFNRDGYLDIILRSWTVDTSPETLNNSTVVYFGGPGGFSRQNRQVLPNYCRCAPSACVADVNNDGWLDFLFVDESGSNLNIYLGNGKGFDTSRKLSYKLKDANGACGMGLTAVDYDKDGKLEILITTGGHYERKPSFLYILRDFEKGYPENKQIVFETGGTAGFVSLADLYGTGWLDLILPFYSTTETRELPLRIFRNDRHGSFDFKNPQTLDCLASIAAFPVDLSRNGYPDLFICCHRNNIGHIVDSLLIKNGPGGLDFDHPQKLLSYGAHNFTQNIPANTLDRSESEFYISPAIPITEPLKLLSWEAKTPHASSIVFRVRAAHTEERLAHAAWGEAITKSGSAIHVPAEAGYMQYMAEFISPALCNSPRLFAVMIE